ncbi:MAG: hypothetical protein IMF14_06245 [Proteobacteria bacterium]|nr:hypothetical protein [Pseudomonadota bacterium]
MNTLYLLIVLTQNGAGDVNASFVNTESLQQCQQKAQMVSAIFITADIPVLTSRCMKSELQFSEFGHASAASRIRNFYLVDTDAEKIEITSVADWKTCVELKRRASSRKGVYCASSVQSILDSLK